MKRIVSLAAVSLGALAYSHGRTETVTVKGGVRVNKADFDADQEKPAGERQYSPATKTETDNAAETDAAARGVASDVNVSGANGVTTTAAPSAPNFSAPDSVAPLPMDPVKNAAAPGATTQDQLLVAKIGGKFYVTDGMGRKIEGAKATELGIDEKGYKTEEAAKAVQTLTQPTGQHGAAATVTE